MSPGVLHYSPFSGSDSVSYAVPLDMVHFKFTALILSGWVVAGSPSRFMSDYSVRRVFVRMTPLAMTFASCRRSLRAGS